MEQLLHALACLQLTVIQVRVSTSEEQFPYLLLSVYLCRLVVVFLLELRYQIAYNGAMNMENVATLVLACCETGPWNIFMMFKLLQLILFVYLLLTSS